MVPGAQASQALLLFTRSSVPQSVAVVADTPLPLLSNTEFLVPGAPASQALLLFTLSSVPQSVAALVYSTEIVLSTA